MEYREDLSERLNHPAHRTARTFSNKQSSTNLQYGIRIVRAQDVWYKHMCAVRGGLKSFACDSLTRDCISLTKIGNNHQMRMLSCNK